MKVEIIEEKRNGRLLVKVDNVKYNLPKGLVAKLTNDSLPVDVRVMPKIAEIIENLSNEAPLDFMGTGCTFSAKADERDWNENKKKAIDALTKLFNSNFSA